MPTLEEIHTKWSRASEEQLETSIALLQQSIMQNEEHVLPRGPTSLAASLKRTPTDMLSETSRPGTVSPPPDIVELGTFLNKKAVLLELYAFLTARHHLANLQAGFAKTDNSIAASCYQNMVRYMAEEKGMGLVTGPCKARLYIPCTNACLKAGEWPEPLEAEPLTDADPSHCDSIAADDAPKAESGNGAAATASAAAAQDVSHVRLPYILRVPLSEDDDFVLNLDLWVDVPRSAIKKAEAMVQQEESRQESLSVSQEASFLSGDKSDQSHPPIKHRYDAAEELKQEATAALTPAHFLWTMQQVPFTLSYLYGTNDISGSTTRTAYATIGSTVSHKPANSSPENKKKKKKHQQQQPRDRPSSTVLSDESTGTTTSSGDGGFGRHKPSSISAHLLSPTSTGSDSSSSRNSSDNDDDEGDDENEDGGKETHDSNGPLKRDETVAPQADQATATKEEEDEEEMVSVRMRLSFTSVRFIAKPKPLSLHTFLVSQPPTRYGTPVRILVLVNILPPPLTFFRPPARLQADATTGDDTTVAFRGAPLLSLTPQEQSEFVNLPVQSDEGTARGFLVVQATDLLHSVDFTVRSGDVRAVGRPFIMYSKEFLSEELVQYLLPSHVDSDSTSPVPLRPCQKVVSKFMPDITFNALNGCAHGHEEWAIPIILPYRLPPSGELEVSLLLDVRFCCQPHRSFRQGFPVRLVKQGRPTSDGADVPKPIPQQEQQQKQKEEEEEEEAAARERQRELDAEEDQRAAAATLTPHGLATSDVPPLAPSAGRSPPLAPMPAAESDEHLGMPQILAQMRSPSKIRTRRPAALFSATPSPSDHDGHLRYTPQLRSSSVRFISTTRLRVASFSLCDGGALVICAERVQNRGSGLQSGTVTPRLSPNTPHARRGQSPSGRQRHRYRSILGFSPMNAMNSCIPIDSVVSVPPAVTEHIVAAKNRLMRCLRPDPTHSSLAGSPQSHPPHDSHAHVTPEGWQLLDLRYLMARGWVFEVRIAEPRAHNTAILRDRSTGQCLVLRVGTEHLEEQVQQQQRDSLSLPPDDPLCSRESGGNNSSSASGVAGAGAGSAFGGSGPSMELILYVPPQSSTKVVEQHFIADSLALLTRSLAAELLWWSTTSRDDVSILLRDCHASRLWELKNGDELTIVAVVLGPRCVIGENGAITFTPPHAPHDDTAARVRTVAIYCLDEQRVLYHFEVLSSTAPQASGAFDSTVTPERSASNGNNSSSSSTVVPVTTGFEIISREEETGALLYWDTERVVIVRCSPDWSHHEVLHVSSFSTSSRMGVSLTRDTAQESELPLGHCSPQSELSSSTRAASTVPVIVAVTGVTASLSSFHAPRVGAGEPNNEDPGAWMLFALLSDGRIVGVRRTAVDGAASPSPPPTAPHGDGEGRTSPWPLQSPHVAVVGTVFNPAFINPRKRVRDIVLCYYAIESQVRRRWSPLQSYTSVPVSTTGAAGSSSGFAQAVNTSSGSRAVDASPEPGPVGVLYLYGVEIEASRLLKDAVVVEA